MLSCTVTKNGNQSKPLEAKLVFALLKNSRIDTADTVTIQMTVGDFVKSAFAREQAVAESIRDRKERLEELKKKHDELKRVVGEAETHASTITMWNNQREQLQQECELRVSSSRLRRSTRLLVFLPLPGSVGMFPDSLFLEVYSESGGGRRV